MSDTPDQRTNQDNATADKVVQSWWTAVNIGSEDSGIHYGGRIIRAYVDAEVSNAAAELERENKQLREVIRENLATIKTLSEQVGAAAELRAQLAEAMKDTERLDWLDAQNAETNRAYGTKYGRQFDKNHNRSALTDHNWPALTVRQAIDEARSATP